LFNGDRLDLQRGALAKAERILHHPAVGCFLSPCIALLRANISAQDFLGGNFFKGRSFLQQEICWQQKKGPSMEGPICLGSLLCESF
jgi:hypothetical protein